MNSKHLIGICLLFLSCMTTKAQDFFNLCANEVKIDSLLPIFTHSIPLGEDFQGYSYQVTIEYPEFIDMSQTDIQRLHAITTDSLPELPEVEAQLCIERKHGVLDVSMVPLVFREGRYQKLVSFKLAVKKTPRQLLRAEAGDAASRYTSTSVLAKGTWAKIRVAQSGVHELTLETVRKAGFSDLNKIKIYGYGGALQPETLEDEYLRRTDDLKEVPQCIVNGKHLFYGQGPVTWKSSKKRVRNPYSDYGYYFITESDDTPLTVDSATFVGSFYPSDDFRNTIYEVDDFAWYAGGRNLYDAQLLSTSSPTTYQLKAPVAGATDATLYVMLSADTPSGTSSATVTLNGETLGTATVSKMDTYGKAQATLSTLRPKEALQATNTITIQQKTGANMRLDYIVLHTETYAPAPALTTESFPAAEYVYRITNQNMHSHQPVEMTIIIPTTQKLLEQAERLKALHEKHDQMSVRIVPADEIFNEFSSGTPDATAYKRYMKMLYDRAATAEEAPKYLVLFGDGAWDNRMKLSMWSRYSPDDFLLCYESENSFNEVYCFVSDDFFCMLDDEESIMSGSETSSSSYKGKGDVAVGRFPVRTEEEAKIMMDKVEAYLNNDSHGPWQNTLVFMGDDGNNNIHMDAAETAAQIAETNYPAYDVKRIHWDAYNRVTSSTGFAFPEVENLVKKYMEEGALLFDYNGHGSANCLSHEMAIKIANFKDDKSGNMPLWITASCDVMAFDGQEENIGETAVLNPNGGAIAFYGTTRTVLSAQNKLMNNAFIREVLSTENGGMGMGEAVRKAKNKLVEGKTDQSVNKLQYTFLGDPALKLATPKLNIVIDSINGLPLSGNTIQMKAGMTVKVDGHVTEGEGVKEDFSGLIQVKVRDAIETITCKLNNTSDTDGASKAFVFQDRTNDIFKGKDSIRTGQFSFTFAVPKDIKYEEGAGQIIVFATNDDKSLTAHGDNESVIFKGTADLNRDSVGPSVFCYLNSTGFRNGDKVNATPYFVAEIRDEDGINAAGGGVGHDIQLVVDNDPQMTFNLNDSFSYDFGSHQSGRVGFSLPELSLGTHRLTFRVWDVLNNPSTAELTFLVAEGQKPQVFNIDCTRNPAVGSTSFRITHDRIGSEVDMTLEIIDISGRILYRRSQTTVPSEATFTMDWDLTIDGGRRLNTGVYLYRVMLSADGTTATSKAKKIIIISDN